GCTEKNAEPDSAAASSTPAAISFTPAAGESFLAVPGGKIWYRVVGSGAATPAILLHGGPGFSSYYMKPYEEGLKADRRIVRYDQLGAGHSDVITDTAMFNIAHFVNELDSLRAHLGYDKVYLIGHSWGTMLAVEYYRVHPEHVAAMVLASPALDIPAWERNARRLVTTLPDSEQRAIKVREAEKKFDAPDYTHALDDFYARYVWRHPDSVNLDSTMRSANMGIYNYMQGPSEFSITGTLKYYDSTPFLKTVKVPVLFTVGEFDEADPPTVKRFAAMTPGAKYAVIPGSAHMVGWDNPRATMKVIGDFLRGVDSADSAHAGH
ncbi:MAG: proline iminopeptidase-family hydrolase, partial [Gemmatimonadota bacterium]|nr:proline iminopeptidase-family hydrolase [Gemmatimonadota bacterium]